MYRLLVVDDEAFITDGLYRMLQGVEEYELDVYKAYSAQKALEFLNRTSVDIVITDIQMPGMSGLDLLKEICNRWPSCMVIFLTGYDTFEYAYQAMQYHAAQYILKSEGDEAILAAVEECIRNINRDEKNESLLAMANEQMTLYQPILRRECLRRLLQNPISQTERESEFKRLGIGLHADSPVMVLAGRLDRYRAGAGDLVTPVDILVKDRLGHVLACEMALSDPNCMLWLIQPLENGGYEHSAVMVKGLTENIQRSCMQMLATPLSFVFDQKPVAWDALPGRVTEMRYIVQYRLDRHSEMAFADCAFFLGEDSGSGDIEGLQALREKTSDLAFCLDCGDRDAFNTLLDEFIETLVRSGPGFLSMEILQSLNLMFISFINKHGLERQVAADPIFSEMPISYSEKQDTGSLQRISRIGNRLLDYWQSARKDRGDAFVANVDRYIYDHLNADLSLVALSEHVYLNPSYLSRRYKEITGRNISDTIAEARMSRAMKLLRDNQYKIGEISLEVGYESPAHFSRLFKRHMGMTPQEYRDGLSGK